MSMATSNGRVVASALVDPKWLREHDRKKDAEIARLRGLIHKAGQHLAAIGTDFAGDHGVNAAWGILNDEVPCGMFDEPPVSDDAAPGGAS